MQLSGLDEFQKHSLDVDEKPPKSKKRKNKQRLLKSKSNMKFKWKQDKKIDKMNMYKVEWVKICILSNKITLFGTFCQKWQKISHMTKKWYNYDIFF
jgi:hypothetical protein